MAHKLERFSKSILQTPQLVSVEKFSEISDFFDTRNSKLYEKTYEAALEANKMSEQFSSEDRDLVETNVGVLRIQGALTDKPTFWSMLCGGTNYRQLADDMDYLCSLPSVDTILLDVSSPGGEAFNCFPTARLLKSKAEASGKKIIAYVDGQSASAAYALTSIAEEVIAHPDAQVGSIGVVVALMDDSKAKKKAGLKEVYITAGKSKVPFKEDGSFKQEFLDGLQDRVSELYEGFVDHVATMRNLSTEAVKNTEAKMFSVNDALDIGLIDKVMEPVEFYDYIATKEWINPRDRDCSEEDYSSKIDNTENLKTQEEVIEMADTNTATPEMLAEIEAMKAQLAEMTAQNAAFKAEKELAEKTSLAEKLEAQAPFLSNKDAIVEQLMSGNDAQKELLNTMINDCANMVESVKAEALAQVEEVQAKAQEDIAQAQADAEQAKKEADNVKSEFGKQETIEDEPADKEVTVQANSGSARTAQLEMAVAQALKNK